MIAYSVQRSSHERQAHRFDADLRQCGIQHAHGQAERRNFGSGIPRAMPFKTSDGRKHACDYAEDQAMGIAQSRLTEQVTPETASNEGQDRYSARQGGMKIVLSTP
jgi:hypothetical protein